MDMLDVSAYIESRYISLKKYLMMGLMDPDKIEQVRAQCLGVVDYYNCATWDRDLDAITKKWEKWSAKFDALKVTYGV